MTADPADQFQFQEYRQYAFDWPRRARGKSFGRVDLAGLHAFQEVAFRATQGSLKWLLLIGYQVALGLAREALDDVSRVLYE